MNITTLRPDTLDRMVRAVERVKEQLAKATKALEAGGVAYAVIGGNAVAAWVSQVDEGAARATRDVDVLIRREDLGAAKSAMAAAGFEYAHVTGVDLFIDGPGGKPSQGVHLLFSGECVKPLDPSPTPPVEDAVQVEGVAYRVLALESLVRMKLVANRDKDRTHVRDLIGVGLIDATWPAKYPAVLAERLQSMLDTPGG